MHATQDAEVTFTANWTINTYVYVYVSSVDEYGNETTAEATVEYDDEFTLSSPTRLGYTFAGWNVTGMDSNTHKIGGSDSTATSLSASTATKFQYLRATDGRVVFVATWTAKTYKLKYTLNSGTAGANHPSSATYGTEFALSNPTRTGYTFLG